MGAPLLLADSLGNVNVYPRVIVTDQSGTSGPVGNEVWRAFSGRRSAFSYWAPGTPNVLAWLQLQHEQVRGANALFLDRGHNLAGFPVSLLGSQDGATFVTVVNATIPTVTGGILAGANGVLTEEGAWAISFPLVGGGAPGYTYWRFNVPAMGTGLQPNIVGLHLGMAYQPLALYRPFSEHSSLLAAQEIVSSIGWRGRGPRAFTQTSTLNLRADVDDFEYLRARFTIEEVFGAGRPMWVIQDQERATEAFYGIRPLGEQGYGRPPQIYWPTATIQVVEHEPAPVN